MLIGFKRLTGLWHEGAAPGNARRVRSGSRTAPIEVSNANPAARRWQLNERLAPWIATGLAAIGSPARMVLAASQMMGQQGRQMTGDFEKMAARAAPAIFVVLWSTGFIGTKYVLNSAEPLTYLAIRMACVVALMAIIVAVARPRWPDRIGIAHSAVAGILVHGIYLGGTAIAIAHSIPAGLSALIPGLQPILTSTLASRWLGERVTPLQ